MGPMIYGAAEASRYYFAKEPSQLNLAECIFMASIIPKPKQVRYCFDGLRLKPYYEDFYRVILDRLVDRGLISSEEAVGVTPESVEITGPAKELPDGYPKSISTIVPTPRSEIIFTFAP